MNRAPPWSPGTVVYAEVNARLHLVCRDGRMYAPRIAGLDAVARAFDFGAPYPGRHRPQAQGRRGSVKARG